MAIIDRELAGKLVSQTERRTPRRRLANRPSLPKQGTSLELADPEPWPEPVDGAQIAADIVLLLRRFLVLPDGAATAITLWAFFANTHDAWQISPLLVFSSPEKRCGKTTTLALLSKLVPRALHMSSITAASVFRTLSDRPPTLLIDEADTFLGDKEDLRGILNSGHLRSAARVIRTVGDDHEPRCFSTWGPKVLAQIGRVPATLEDRSVLILMRRRTTTEHVERLRLDRLPNVETPLRRMWRWGRDNFTRLADAEPMVPEGLHDRAADNWRPLLAIADALGGAWPQEARRAALVLSGSTEESDNTPGIQLLGDLAVLFQDRGVEEIPSLEIVASLNGLEERPWAEWKRGQPITQTQLARILKPFGVKPRTIRDGNRTPRAYRREDFADAFARYLPLDPKQTKQASAGNDLPPTASQNTSPHVLGSGERVTPSGAPEVSGVLDQMLLNDWTVAAAGFCDES